MVALSVDTCIWLGAMDASFILSSIVIVKSEKEDEGGETEKGRVWGKRKGNAGIKYCK